MGKGDYQGKHTWKRGLPGDAHMGKGDYQGCTHGKGDYFNAEKLIALEKHPFRLTSLTTQRTTSLVKFHTCS